MPKVSVILTSYNHGKWLREAIDSVLEQTFQDFEFIIWDDASTDDSWDIIKSYDDPRIRAFRNEKNAYGAPLLEAFFDVATCDYIAIHHSDDAWELNKLEKQVEILDRQPEVGAVFTWVNAINGDGKIISTVNVFTQANKTRHEWLRHFLLSGNALCHPSVLIRRRCYQDCGGVYRLGMRQLPDFDMWVRLCLKYEIHVIPEPLVRFRWHDDASNSSAPNPATNNRTAFENYLILENYRQIDQIEDVLKIFPEATKYLGKNASDPRFVLAIMLVNTATLVSRRLFAQEMLYEIFKDPARAVRVKELHGFDHLDFMKITGEFPLFANNPQSAYKTAESANAPAQGMTNPYYICAPDYKDSSEGIKCLHHLCDALNRAGFQAWISGCNVTKEGLLTPELTHETILQHQREGRAAIAVYPEIVTENILHAPVVVHWMMNKDGLISGEKIRAGKDDLFFYFQKHFTPDPEKSYDYLAFSFVDTHLFKPDPECTRSHPLLYVNRIPESALDLSRFPPDIEILSNQRPVSLEALALKLQRATMIYTYEHSGTLHLAMLCGCPVIALTHPQYERLAYGPVMIADHPEGIYAFSDDPEEIEKSRKNLWKMRDFIQSYKDNSVAQLKVFIEKTQKAAESKTGTWEVSAIQQGITAFNAGTFTLALDCFSTAMTQEPENPLPLAYLAFIAVRQGLFSEAQDFFAQCENLAPERHDLKAAFGETLLQAEQPLLAVEHLMAAIGKQPDLYAAYPALAEALRRAGRATEAISLLQTVATIKSNAQAGIQGLLLNLLLEGGDFSGFAQWSQKFLSEKGGFCPVCGSVDVCWLPLPDFFHQQWERNGFQHFDSGEMTPLETYLCPKCGASDRERLYALFLKLLNAARGEAQGGQSMIHFAPETALSKHIRQQRYFASYVTADRDMPGMDFRSIDLQDLIFKDNTYDFFICSHVLEHVPDDRQAIRELYRITKPGGCGLLMAPIVMDIEKTLEDPSITDEGKRWRLFGQGDHIRLYSHDDYVARIMESGFSLLQMTQDDLGRETFFRLGLKSTSILYVVSKETPLITPEEGQGSQPSPPPPQKKN